LIPYYVAKMEHGPDQGNRTIYVLYLVSALLHLTFTLSLIPLLAAPGWCTSPTEVEWVVNKISGTPIWKTAIFLNCSLNFLFESAIMLGVFSFRRGDNRGEDMRGVIGWLFTLGYFFVIPTVLPELTVSWLYEVSGGSDSV